MEELISTFHIDWKLIIAQLINFAVVLVVLKMLVLRPLMQLMHERSSTIEKSLRQAEEIKKKRAETQETIQQELGDARKQAIAIIHQAKSQAELKRKELVEQAQLDAQGIVSSAEERIQSEQDAMLKRVHGEMASLVTLGISRVLEGVVDKKVDEQVVSEQLKKVV